MLSVTLGMYIMQRPSQEERVLITNQVGELDPGLISLAKNRKMTSCALITQPVAFCYSGSH